MAPFLPHDDMSFGDLLAFQRDKAGLTQQQLAQTLGIQYQQVSAYERNVAFPRKGRLIQICEIVNASYADLAQAKFRTQNPGLPEEAFAPVTPRRLPPIPIIGQAAAGQGLFPNLDDTTMAADDYMDRPDDLKEEQVYGLRVYGDSMTPVVKPGSVVIASQDTTCRNGDLAVVVTHNGEALIKVVYYKGEQLQLTSSNPAYPDRLIPREDVLHLHPVVHIRLARM
ncbi:MAG: helix-turn-helix transcriptional regulator [Candidatus Marinimicrobia bacterium]|nr:helix-turn-helix transcriptional regulator [Candidatus Neomarinimicrobiota bacterium]